MITNQIKPSDTKNWDIIRFDPKKQSETTKALKHPEWYAFFLNDGLWYPHRKPTVSEIIKDEFK